jgi:hypothetical protein
MVFGIPASERRFLLYSSVVEIHCLCCAPAKQSAPPDAESGKTGFHALITPYTRAPAGSAFPARTFEKQSKLNYGTLSSHLLMSPTEKMEGQWRK